ncbi:MAG: META domain-containing protein [Methyloprofundus sp.]|nr:META domain-containing protein [Methyloprofundus sp.]
MKRSLFFLAFLMVNFMSGCAVTETQSLIKGYASYRERIGLPPNAIFKVTLEDISLMDVAATTLGSVTIDPAGQAPINFAIGYNPEEIKPGHRYAVRGRITVDDKLMFITDTTHPVLAEAQQNTVSLKMVHVQHQAKQARATKSMTFTNFPIHLLGLLPGANCQTQYQLDLFSNHAYFISVQCFKNGKPSTANPYDIGRWHIDPSTQKLILTGGHESPLFFRVIDSNTVEKLDLQGNKIDSNLNYQLERSMTATTLEPTVLMQGMYQYMADAANFRECITGLKLPVVFEGDHQALESAYLKDQSAAGTNLKVHIEGSIVQRPIVDGVGEQAVLHVERFIKTMPTESCDNPYVDASFTNTYWRLTALNGKGIDRTQPAKREAHLIFHNANDGTAQVSGSTGCNRISGTYQQDDQQLSIASEGMAMTRMACANAKAEQAFLSTLEVVTGWAVKGNYLELYDAGGGSVARFEATYLY